MRELKNDQEAKKLLNLAIKLGRTMLKHGAEIYRVEDTITRIYKSYDNIKAANALVTYNFIIVSFIYNDTHYTNMRRVVLGEKNLEKISLINSLSRQIVSGSLNLDESFKQLTEIKNMRSYPGWAVIAAMMVSGPFFAIMFGGTFKDSIFAMLIMIIESAFLIFATKVKVMNFLSNFLGAFIATVVVMLAAKFLPITNPSSIIIVSIMPLVPGVQVTNSVRDFMAGDYISGMIGLQAAVFGATTIALGVVFGLKLV